MKNEIAIALDALIDNAERLGKSLSALMNVIENVASLIDTITDEERKELVQRIRDSQASVPEWK